MPNKLEKKFPNTIKRKYSVKRDLAFRAKTYAILPLQEIKPKIQQGDLSIIQAKPSSNFKDNFTRRSMVNVK